jgi:hypothetical protein
MRQRCWHDPRYYKRGIKFCDRWNSYAAFEEDMGHPPSPQHTLERKDNSKDYSPENCRWATMAEQNRNHSATVMIKYLGRTQCVIDWCKELGLKPATVYARIARKRTHDPVVLFAKPRIYGFYNAAVKPSNKDTKADE